MDDLFWQPISYENEGKRTEFLIDSDMTHTGQHHYSNLSVFFFVLEFLKQRQMQILIEIE